MNRFSSRYHDSPIRRIEDYAMIGNGESAALVNRDGSIDWLCWPRFDSGACFAALLGDPDNGRWIIAAKDVVDSKRHYTNGSLILTTKVTTETGVAEIIDFMPRACGGHVVRIVRGMEGRVDFWTEFILRFDYGSIVPWVERTANGLRAVAGPDLAVLRSDVALRSHNFRTVGNFTITAGQSLSFVLSYSGSDIEPPTIDPYDALAKTESFWLEWATRCAPAGRWTEAVVGSLTVLKGMIYHRTGGIIAAPTTSLPEWPKSVRNWDYRYCWLRDATFTLLALGSAGYFSEARDWRDWLVRAIAGRPDQLQIMYGVGGERRVPEWEIPWLNGFEGTKPVRVGNAAARQLQLDVYGEIIDAMFQARIHGLPPAERWSAIGIALLNYLESAWKEPDEGVWEVRGPRQHFTHSKAMAWVAFDRAVKFVEQLGAQGPVTKWKAIRDEIHADVCRRGFDRELNSFVQAYGSKTLDASLLLLPMVGFLPPQDSRIVGTLAAIESRLLINGVVYRYDTDETLDGLPPGEGAFLACSFWFVDNLILQNRLEKATAMFERLLLFRNDVGLMAEEYDPLLQRQLGNFPQAFSHVALVNTAYNLTRREGPTEERAECKGL